MKLGILENGINGFADRIEATRTLRIWKYDKIYLNTSCVQIIAMLELGPPTHVTWMLFGFVFSMFSNIYPLDSHNKTCVLCWQIYDETYVKTGLKIGRPLT